MKWAFVNNAGSNSILHLNLPDDLSINLQKDNFYFKKKVFYHDLTCVMLNQTEYSNDIILIIKYMLNMRKFQIRLATLLIYSTAFKGT